MTVRQVPSHHQAIVWLLTAALRTFEFQGKAGDARSPIVDLTAKAFRYSRQYQGAIDLLTAEINNEQLASKRSVSRA